MNILEKIVAQKQLEVAARKQKKSIEELKSAALFNSSVYSITSFLNDPGRTGIIAEFKRKSPSKGIINGTANVVEVTGAYAKHASAVSVLTDFDFFGGEPADLIAARVHPIPILRKDFMIDPYQVYEAKAMGADLILLIAACLSKEAVKSFAILAKSLGMEVLLEIHDDTELKHICDEVDLVGVNNRNLKTFEVSIQTSLNLINKIPSNKLAVAESGISDVNTIVTLRNAGFKGFLIGENFMKEADPSIAFADFVNQLKAK
jgi:indole-3-glycerol phosphate synthase